MKLKAMSGLTAFLAVLLLAGCSPPFAPELLDRVDRTTAYSELQKAPDRFTGRVLMLGGIIVEARNLKEGTQLEVLQQPLDGRGRPLRPMRPADAFSSSRSSSSIRPSSIAAVP